MTVPGDAPGKSQTVYFAKLPLGGEATGDIFSVIGEIEAQYRSDEAMKAHFRKLEVWAQAFARRTADWQRAHIDMTDLQFQSAHIVDALFDSGVESYETEEDFATEVAPAAAGLTR
ncbi:hypothetical protein [Rhizobium sp. WSM1325]|uniref:hypothetical protein n=1 Tax=Rhizobium sp. WSM1325 TaxID=3444086 RepID=UPI000FF0E973|nr:hypothetical protein [Rhizobium leguminosarum]RWY80894.1 hypothetical protein EHI48_05655 [Rhizobium leguminosarum]